MPLNLIKKPAEQVNPMDNSEYCYTQALGKALVGFAKALELRQGKLNLVTTQDILAYSDVDSKEFDFLFSDPYGLLEAMKDDARKTFTEDIKLIEGLNRKAQLTCIFRRFKKSTPILTVLRMIGDHTVWAGILRTAFTGWTTDWPAVSYNIREYIYRCFCCQFSSVLEKWEESDFKGELIQVCVQLVEDWLDADASMATSIGYLVS